MLAMFSPMSLEAQKLITVSIGKINASRVTRTGSSLHKSLLVASVLHRARTVYFDEERERAMRYPHCSPPPSELTVTPVCHHISTPEPVTNSDQSNVDKENRLACHEDEVTIPDRLGNESRLPLAEANTGNNVTHTTTTTTTVTSITNTSTITTTSSSQSTRKRRRVSDQETAAAISSILPKRLRSELKEESLKQEKVISCTSDESLTNSELIKCTPDIPKSTDISPPDVTLRLSAPEGKSVDDSSNANAEPTSSTADDTEEHSSVEHNKSDASTDDSDSDEDSASDTSVGSSDEMEVDQLTSLVSYFSFSQSQKPSDYCLGSIHHSQSGAHVVALTA